LLAQSPARRRKIAVDSGRSEQQVSQLIAQLFQMRAGMKNMMGAMQGGTPGTDNLEEALKVSQKVPPGMAKRRKNRTNLKKQLTNTASLQDTPRGFGAKR